MLHSWIAKPFLLTGISLVMLVMLCTWGCESNQTHMEIDQVDDERLNSRFADYKLIIDAEISLPEHDMGSIQDEGVMSCIPQKEICNGFDEDCDGLIDESFPLLGMVCEIGEGECATQGTYVCGTDYRSTSCNEIPQRSSTERCDGLDNDCDGLIDEAEACSRTLIEGCTLRMGWVKSYDENSVVEPSRSWPPNELQESDRSCPSIANLEERRFACDETSAMGGLRVLPFDRREFGRNIWLGVDWACDPSLGHNEYETRVLEWAQQSCHTLLAYKPSLNSNDRPEQVFNRLDTMCSSVQGPSSWFELLNYQCIETTSEGYSILSLSNINSSSFQRLGISMYCELNLESYPQFDTEMTNKIASYLKILFGAVTGEDWRDGEAVSLAEWENNRNIQWVYSSADPVIDQYLNIQERVDYSFQLFYTLILHAE